MTIPDTDWTKLCTVATEFERLARTAGLLGGQISQATAYRKYGRDRVNRWRGKGLVNPIKQSTRIYYDIDELNKAAISYEKNQ